MAYLEAPDTGLQLSAALFTPAVAVTFAGLVEPPVLPVGVTATWSADVKGDH